MKTVGKNTKPFEYDVNKIPDDYTVLVTNRFKGLDLIDSMPEELWMEVQAKPLYRPKQSPRKRNARRQSGCLRRPYK